MVGGPCVPAIVIQIDGSRVFRLVEIYLGNLVIRNEQSVDFLSALHEDRRAFSLGHQQVGLLLVLGHGCHARSISFGSIVDSILIPLGGGITGVARR